MRQHESISFYILDYEILHKVSDALSLIYILKGSAEIEINRYICHVREEEFLAIPPYSVYKIRGDVSGYTALEIRIDHKYLKQCGWPEPMRRHFVTDDCSGESEIIEIRRLFADCYMQSARGGAIRITLAIQRLVKKILRNQIYSESSSDSQMHQMEHVSKALAYIFDHWREEIDGRSLAQQEFLSASYLSHLFKKWMNQSIVKYISEVRLYYASKMLAESDASITEIALNAGFKNSNRLIHCFRDKYGETPGKYRKCSSDTDSAITEGYFNDYSALTKYCVLHPETSAKKDVVHIRLSCDANKGRMFTPSWKRLINVAFAKDLLLAPVRSQLTYIQERAGFQYIHFHGIFDKELYVYGEDERGGKIQLLLSGLDL